MARVAERLTVRRCDTAKATGRPVMLADGKGLYLRVAPSGSRSWIYRYQVGDRQHDLGLGPYPEITLADARERALTQRRLRLAGDDPLSVKRSQRAAAVMTFADCARQYLSSHRSAWRSKT